MGILHRLLCAHATANEIAEGAVGRLKGVAEGSISFIDSLFGFEASSTEYASRVA
jgi:hypothetical protein